MGEVDGGGLKYSCPQLEDVTTGRKTRDVAVEVGIAVNLTGEHISG